ncbi:MAG: hypothetical protein J7K73_04405, partial [Nanoarchaeota archaeon]|nr:hypothetical protein [Nanoarchaeota archaeon]
MEIGMLTTLSLSAVVLTSIIITILLKERNTKEIMKYVVIGTIVALADIIIEFLGTSTHHWTYKESIYFLLGKIPIELVLLFFSAGIIARFIFIHLNQIKIPIRVNAMLYVLILITFLNYVREIYQQTTTTIIPLAILVGLWGIVNISERNREGALLLAILAAFADWISEVVIIGSGSYSYANGFNLSIPIIYGLFTLGLLAIMEKLHKLDKLFDHPLISKLLK